MVRWTKSDTNAVICRLRAEYQLEQLLNEVHNNASPFPQRRKSRKDTTMNRNEKYPEGEMLYRFALDCAEHKINNDCNHICRNCPSNISAYITTKNMLRPPGSDGLTPREAVMLQHTAELEMRDLYTKMIQQQQMELEYKQQEQQSNAEYVHRLRKALIVLLVIIVAPVALVWQCENDNNKRYAVSAAVAPPAPAPVVKYDKNGWYYDKTTNKWAPGPNAVYK
jgi:hypothetical protein